LWSSGEKPDFALFNRNAIKSGASRPKDVPKWKATKVGILGAGMMGRHRLGQHEPRRVLRPEGYLDSRSEAGKAYSAKMLERRGREMNPLMLIKATTDMHDPRGLRPARMCPHFSLAAEFLDVVEDGKVESSCLTGLRSSTSASLPKSDHLLFP